MAGKEIFEGATGRTVRENIRRVREERDMTWAQMSRFLDKAGRPIAPLGLRRVEEGARRVDVDDLMAIAVVLDVTPNELLLPAQPSGPVDITGAAGRDSEHLRAWANGHAPLQSDEPWAGFRSGRKKENAKPLVDWATVFSGDDFKRAVREAMRDE
jgi:transcriptional regulator with XRE-family HTH domain